MKTFTINTLGCKVNQYESQQIRQLLQDRNLTQAGPKEVVDLVVINTCCVTHIASSKSRQNIRKAQKQNANAVVIVVGCLTSDKTDELQNITDAVLLRSKEDLPKTLDNLIFGANNSECNHKTVNRTCKEPKIKHKNHLRQPDQHKKVSDEYEDGHEHDDLGTLRSYSGQSRAFLKIQDGCDGYCTYCIIPNIRTQITYKPKDIVIKEASDLIYAGNKEIVLTGIFLGAYGYETVRRKKWQQNQ